MQRKRSLPLAIRLALTLLFVTAISMVLLSTVALILVRVMETNRRTVELEGQADLYAALAEQLVLGNGNLQRVTPLLVNRSVGTGNVAVRVFGSAGELFGANGDMGAFPSRVAAAQLTTRVPQVIFSEDRTRRYSARRIEWNAKTLGVVEVSQSTAEETRLFRLLRTVAGYSIVVALLAAIGGSALIARWLARLIGHLRTTTERIAGGDLSERAVERGPHEFVQLSHAINTMTDQLAERLERIEQQSAAQQRFYRDVSHELRTPLMALGGYVENIEDARNDDERDEALIAMQREIERLARLSDELLRVDAAPTFELGTRTNVDLNELAHDVVAMLQPRARRSHVQLQFQPASAPVHVNADRDRLKQAMINVLDNALRSTPTNGTITVTITQSAKTAFIDIIDDGAGVPANLREAIWERGVRGADGGSGLGLAIVRTIMQAHRGNATLEPSEHGAHIRLTLPLEA